MSPRARKTAAVVTSAVIIGGGGVAAAAAATGPSAKRSDQQAPAGAGHGYGGPGFGPGGGHGPGRGGLPSDALAQIAKTLGVTTDQLQSALESARPTAAPEDRRGAFAEELAAALGIDEARVEAALEKIAADHEADRGTRKTALFDAIAKSLGLDATAVQKAFEAARP